MNQRKRSQRGSAIIGFIVIPLVISAGVMIFGKFSGEISSRENATQATVENSTIKTPTSGVNLKPNN